jgi:hypothetical protein
MDLGVALRGVAERTLRRKKRTGGRFASMPNTKRLTIILACFSMLSVLLKHKRYSGPL